MKPARAPRASTTRRTRRAAGAARAAAHDVDDVILELKRLATKKTLEGMTRYALPQDKAFGVSVSDMQRYAKQLGKDHVLAAALWKSGWYEARMLAAFVDDPALVTPSQMDAWAAEFDNWGICDTVCFKLFDRSPHAFAAIDRFAKRDEEFVKRAAFALLASVAAHVRDASDAEFTKRLALIERAAVDDRNFVKKGVLWALRAVGDRGPTLHRAAGALATKLSGSQSPPARWIGKSALRELAKRRRA